MATSHHAEHGVFVDKDGVPHYNGDPFLGEEWAERAILGLGSCLTAQTQKAYIHYA